MNIIREFKNITVKEGHLKASYEEHNENRNDTYLITYENQAGIHPDLNSALQKLTPHVRQIIGLPADQPLVVNGYYRQNAGNAQLLTIYARLGRECQEDSHRNANLAARLYIGRDDYKATDRLLDALSDCEREAIAYIKQGKTFECDQAVTLEDTDLLFFNQPIAQC